MHRQREKEQDSLIESRLAEFSSRETEFKAVAQKFEESLAERDDKI